MHRLALLLLPLLHPTLAMAQDRVTDPVAVAMAALNVVLPPEAEEALALSAAPAHLRAGATVYVYGTAGFRRVRTGTNGFSCLVNRDAFLYGAPAFKPTCWDAAGEQSYLPVMLLVGRLLAAGRPHRDIVDAINAGFAAGTFKAPDTGGVAYMLAGDVALDPTTGQVTRQLFAGHYMFYAAGVTNEQLGYTADAARADHTLPFVFAAGAGGARGLGYIIAVPGTRPAHEPPDAGVFATPEFDAASRAPAPEVI